MRTRGVIAALLALSVGSRGVVVTLPTATTRWNSNDPHTNIVKWSAMPLTDPPPRSNLFTIWIRNGSPMYSPALNTTLVERLDWNDPSKTSFQVPNAAEFKAGLGYQLFFADPGDASVVYCDSDVFEISAGPTSPASLPDSTQPDQEPTTTTTEESTPASPSTPESLVASSQTTFVMIPSSLASSTAASGGGRDENGSAATSTQSPSQPQISQALSPGGLSDQKHGLTSDGSPVSASRAAAHMLAIAVGTVGLACLL